MIDVDIEYENRLPRRREEDTYHHPELHWNSVMLEDINWSSRISSDHHRLMARWQVTIRRSVAASVIPSDWHSMRRKNAKHLVYETRGGMRSRNWHR